MSDTRETCRYCRKPQANAEDCDTFQPGEGEHLCWQILQNCDQDQEDAIDLRDAEIERLERELDASEQTGRQIWKANDRLKSELGSPTDSPDANTTAHARINWWRDRCDDLWNDLAAERALADRLASELSACKNTFGIEFGGTTEALAAWKEARRDP
jgi:predicted RNase H-like nuclease (RuvC/YqgF family)